MGSVVLYIVFGAADLNSSVVSSSSDYSTEANNNWKGINASVIWRRERTDPESY